MTEIPAPPAPATRWWHEFTPAEAVDINLRKRPDIAPPMNELGFFCPWPWGPQQLVGAPLGQHHCNYCGGMQMAGMAHLDWRDTKPEDYGPPLDDGTYPPAPEGRWDDDE